MGTGGWHRADIVAAVRKLGTSLAELGRDNGLSSGTLGACLTYPRGPSNTIIAKFLGKQLHEIWPKWFDEKGQLITPIDAPRPYRQKSSNRRSGRSIQKTRKKLSLTGRRT